MLARSLGVLDVNGMLARMPAPEFDRWLAAYILDPWCDSFRIELAMKDEDIIDVFRRLAQREKRR